MPWRKCFISLKGKEKSKPWLERERGERPPGWGRPQPGQERKTQSGQERKTQSWAPGTLRGWINSRAPRKGPAQGRGFPSSPRSHEG